MQILPHSMKDDEEKENSASNSNSEMPIPRFAHQVVYNPNTRTIFLHGGNAGGGGSLSGQGGAGRDGEGDAVGGVGTVEEVKELGGPAKEKRLDDFWRMELKRLVFSPWLLARH